MLKDNDYINAWANKLIHKNLQNLFIPKNTEEAYKLQSNYQAYSKYDLFGWKIAATSIEGQEHIGVNSPIAGRLIKERLYKSGDNVSLISNQMKVAEAEFSLFHCSGAESLISSSLFWSESLSDVNWSICFRCASLRSLNSERD